MASVSPWRSIPRTGRTLWTQKADEPILAGQALRGVAYWGEGADARVLTYRGRYLYALNPKTGEPITSFGEGGRVDLDRDLGPLGGTYRWNGAPLVVRDVVVMGSEMVSQDSAGKMEGEPGDVRAYDVRTGKLRWTFRVIPRPGEVGNETWENDSWSYTGAANVWSLMSADEELGLRLPADVERHQRHVRRPPARRQSVQLVDRVRGRRDGEARLAFSDGSPRPLRLRQPGGADSRRHHGERTPDQGRGPGDQAVVGLRPRSRHGHARLAHRRAAGSGVNGARRARIGTQPVPTRPPAFDRQGISVDDLIDFTPELRAEAHGDCQELRDGPGLHTAVGPGRGPERQEGHDPDARVGRRRRLDRGCVRSRDRNAVCPVDDEPVRREPAAGRSKGDEPAVPRGIARAAARAAGPAARQAALRPHHGA